MVDFNRFIKELEKFGQKNYMFNIPRESAKYVHNEILRNKSKKILEVGMSNGYSTIWLSKAAQKNKGKVTTIEIDSKKIELAKSNFEKLKLKNIKIKQGNALEIILKLKQRFDFVFIDATKRQYLEYFKLLEMKLNKNAVVIADNILSHKEKVKDFVDYFKGNKRYKTKLIGVGNGLLKIRKI